MADTLNYLVGGYVIFAVVMVFYLVSLYTRWRGLENEQKMLDDMQK
jgi:hypothetical protein